MTEAEHLEPTPEQFAGFLAAAERTPGPVTMVNLLRFNVDDGLDEYLAYGAAVQPHLDRVGAQIVYAGNPTQVVIGGDAAPWWDAIILVRYPSRAAFVEMVTHPDYAAVGELRAAALQTSALVATQSWEA